MSAEKKQKLLKVADIAERLNCSISNVYSIVASGELRAYRVGRGNSGLRFSEEQIQEFLRRRETRGEFVPRSEQSAVRRLTPNLNHLSLD